VQIQVLDFAVTHSIPWSGGRSNARIGAGAGVKLCEHSYGRGVREDAQEVGVV